MREEAAREKAEAELLRLHPDFDEIRNTDEFHDWVEEQPRWVKEALYENDSDAKSAARAIDLYKADMGLTKKKKKDDSLDNARAVRGGGKSSPTENGNNDLLYESQVAKMTAQQYEAAEEKIAEAIRKGKFVYDVSGNAR
jgi:hypothetical protein